MINRTYRKNKKILPIILYYSPLILQTFIWPATRFILWFFGHLKVRGLDNLKKIKRGQGIIFTANHTSELDPILLPASLPFLSRFMPIYYTSREKAFYQNSGWRQIFYGGLFFKLWGAHPIRPGLQDYEKSLETHIRLIEEGKSVLIFPEGKKTIDGFIHPENARGGLGFMAEKTGKIVVPVLIKNVYKLSLKTFFLRKNHIIIEFFPPMTFSEFSKDAKHTQSSENIYKDFSFKVLKNILISG